MLDYFDNLTEYVDLTAYLHFIESLKPYQGSTWENDCADMKALKKYIKETLETFQNFRCAYCGLEYTTTGYANIEHIARKKKYPQFIFEPKNLVASCFRCNGFEKKGNIDAVAVLSANYDECTFTIVHPYFDNPTEHFEFINEQRGLVICYKTAKGEASINIFKLNETCMIEQRAKFYLLRHIGNKERKEQIDAIMAYSK